MSRRRVRLAVAAALVLGLAGASIALASGGSSKHARHHGNGQFRARLLGGNEVPFVNTTGHAKLKLELTSSQITFQLDYADLSGNPMFAHIHIGQKGVNGNVLVFFCGGGGKPACPASPSGSVSGTIVPADVLGIPTQGFAAHDLAALEKAIERGVAYANMHTVQSPGGEIRGQIKGGHHGDKH